MPWDMGRRSQRRDQRHGDPQALEARDQGELGALGGRGCRQGAMEGKLGSGFLPGSRVSLPCCFVMPQSPSSRVRPLSIVPFTSAVGHVPHSLPSAIGGGWGVIVFYPHHTRGSSSCRCADLGEPS